MTDKSIVIKSGFVKCAICSKTTEKTPCGQLRKPFRRALLLWLRLCLLSSRLIVFEGGDLALLELIRHIDIDVHGGAHIGVAEHVLDYLQVDPGFTEPGREGMPENVAGEVRQQYRIFRVLILFQHFQIAVPHDPGDRIIERSLMLDLSVPVDEDKAFVSVDVAPADKTGFLLILFLHLEGFSDALRHGNLTAARFRFRGVD